MRKYEISHPGYARPENQVFIGNAFIHAHERIASDA
jgi:hypothetical protein